MKNQFGIILLSMAIIAVAAWVIKQPTMSGRGGGELGQPLSRFEERPKLLTFGLFVTPNPDQNPIDPPERFVGYHTALDLETFEDEAGVDVEVKAICDGQVKEARMAEGYGGVLIHSCVINGQEVTVLYGHLDPNSFAKKVGDAVSGGERLAVLGDAKSEESGFTRKHLHLGIHKGSALALLGYVQTEQELEAYLDPLPLLSK